MCAGGYPTRTSRGDSTASPWSAEDRPRTGAEADGAVTLDVCTFEWKLWRCLRLTGGDDQRPQHTCHWQAGAIDHLADRHPHLTQARGEPLLPGVIRRCWRRFSRRDRGFKMVSNKYSERLPVLVGQPLKLAQDLRRGPHRRP
jgi:hypothetical protein